MESENGISEFKELKPSKAVTDLLNYIRSQVKTFHGSDEFIDILEKKKNENQYSLSFCVFMTNKCASKYYFARENSQLGSSVIDIGVYIGSILIFTLEAKVLPTPQGTPNKARALHEYVHGKGAGIQRFKDGKHGLDNLNNPLDASGLIGFLKEESNEYWYRQINAWIKEAEWDANEVLTPVNNKDYSFLSSRHFRTDGTSILLFHFLIDVAAFN